MSAQLPAWVTLSLREEMSAEAVAQRLTALGVRASVTRDGLVFPGGFLGRVEPRLDPWLLDQSIAAGPIELGPSSLVITGGTNELARNEHAQPAALRHVAKEMAAAHAAMVGLTASGRIESAASRKMSALTELVMAAAPLASAIVLPKANNIAFDVQAFVARAADYVGGDAYHFPLWSFLKLRADETSDTIASTGLWTYGLPDVAIAMPPGDEIKPRTEALGALKREMVAEGLWFDDGASFASSLGTLTIHRVRDALFVTVGEQNAALSFARARFARQRCYSMLLGDSTHHHRPAGLDEIAVEHFLRTGGRSIALTNGLSDRAQLGATAGDQNDFIELTVTSPALGPWADGWLFWAAGCIRANDGSRPIKPLDRLILPQPTKGLAGAIVWPMGHLSPERAGDATVWLWDLIPFTEDELAWFRAQPTAQRTWIDERLARGDIPLIQQRFTRG